MASEWTIATIDEVSDKVAMGPFGSSIKVNTFVHDGIPIISGQHLHGSLVDDRPGFNFISEEHAERLRNANVQRGDVIFTHAGNIGQVAYIPTSSKYDRYVISQRQFYMRCNPKRILPEFVVAFFKSPDGRHKLLANTSQTGVPSIARPVSYLRTIEIPIPPIEEQRAIAHILGTLDDKIELNRRMNETLEAMARALFKAWFVDFEPVRAKLSGRWRRDQSLPGLPAHLYDLFPDRLVESELGEIPEGWDLGVLGDVLSLRNERTQASNVASTLPYVPIECINTKNPFLSSWMEGSEAKSSLTLFKRGDVLFGAMRPYFHKVCITPFDGVTRTTVFTLKANKPEYTAYALMLVFQKTTVEYATLHSEGSTIPYAKWKDSFEKMPIIRASKKLHVEFDRFVNPLLKQANENIQHSRSLIQFRDSLLPKLISGELSIPNAKSITGETI